MKKFLLSVVCLSFVVLVVACSNEKSDERSLETFISAYTSAGVEVDPDEKPLFQMINAQDGVIFYKDNSPVKLYEFKSEKEMKKALEENKFTDWPTNGKFAIETKNDEVIKIFNEVK